MTRPTSVQIDTAALLHNLARIKSYAPDSKIMAMVKANGYGCGLSFVIPTLIGHVDLFGVACFEEAMAIRWIEPSSDIMLMQGVFGADELHGVAHHGFQMVVHQKRQLDWLLTTPLSTAITVWMKVNTGMHRLGFEPNQISEVYAALQSCPWVNKPIGIMSHLACADDPASMSNQLQFDCFQKILSAMPGIMASLSNSAAMMSFPQMHFDLVRPGIMLYGVSPIAHQVGVDFGLKPVMCLESMVTSIHTYGAGARVGYGGSWETKTDSVIGVVPVGYGDGYPRHIQPGTPVWVHGYRAPIVGRVSMDMLTVDLTDCPGVREGDKVELWGNHIPIEIIAQSAGTIAYELMCQLTSRVRQMDHQ